MKFVNQSCRQSLLNFVGSDFVRLSQFGRPQLVPRFGGALNPWLRILSGQRSVVCGSESSVVSGFCQW